MTDGAPQKNLNNWDELGFLPVSNPPSKLDALTSQQQLHIIRRWFLDNFEDPVHSTPYESREGGYQYFSGGPYEAQDIISDVFGDEGLSPETLEEVITHLNDISWEWVPSENRIIPPDKRKPAR